MIYCQHCGMLICVHKDVFPGEIWLAKISDDPILEKVQVLSNDSDIITFFFEYLKDESFSIKTEDIEFVRKIG